MRDQPLDLTGEHPALGSAHTLQFLGDVGEVKRTDAARACETGLFVRPGDEVGVVQGCHGPAPVSGPRIVADSLLSQNRIWRSACLGPDAHCYSRPFPHDCCSLLLLT